MSIFGKFWGQNVILEVLGSKCDFGEVFWGQNVILGKFGVEM
jgi:hypothetical protein